MHRYAILLLGLSALPAADETQPFPTAPVRCTREAACLAQLKGLARRSGDVLTLRLENGRALTLRGNRKACASDGDKCLIHELRAYLPAVHLYVVKWTAYEDTGSEIVSSITGEVLRIDTLPEFSPGGRRFVSVDRDEMNGETYLVAIWSVSDGKPQEEFRYAASEANSGEGWEFVGWDGEERIRLKVRPHRTSNDVVHDAEAVRTATGWVLNRPKLD